MRVFLRTLPGQQSGLDQEPFFHMRVEHDRANPGTTQEYVLRYIEVETAQELFGIASRCGGLIIAPIAKNDWLRDYGFEFMISDYSIIPGEFK